MAFVVLLTLCALPTVQAAVLAQSSLQLQTTELNAKQVADRTFASSARLLDTLEADVVQLSSKLSAPTVSQPAPVAKVTLHKKGMDATTAVKEMAKLKPGQMTPMLGLLTGMYDSWKEKIGDANKREHEQKTAFDKTIKDLEAKKAANKDSKDAQDTYDRIEKYWKRQRSIAHRQYHTALKIMHSGMQKFKAVSGVMEHAIAGKKPTAQDLHTIGMGMPDVVLLQQEVQGIGDWTLEASKDLRTAKDFKA